MAEPYRLLHASDFHLSKVPYSAGTRNPSRLSKFKRYKLIGHDDAVLRRWRGLSITTGTNGDSSTSLC